MLVEEDLLGDRSVSQSNLFQYNYIIIVLELISILVFEVEFFSTNLLRELHHLIQFQEYSAGVICKKKTVRWSIISYCEFIIIENNSLE